jgi:excinuclease UvrABC nuclease subunit
METAAKELDFVEAARLRDQMKSFQEMLKNKI